MRLTGFNSNLNFSKNNKNVSNPSFGRIMYGRTFQETNPISREIQDGLARRILEKLKSAYKFSVGDRGRLITIFKEKPNGDQTTLWQVKNDENAGENIRESMLQFIEAALPPKV